MTYEEKRAGNRKAQRKYRQRNPDYWRTDDPEKRAESQRQYRLRHPDRVRAAQQKYRAANIERLRQRDRKFHLAKREEYALRSKLYRAAHPERVKAYAKAYVPRACEWIRKKRETDLNFRIKNILRSRICNALRRQQGKKAAPTDAILGCSIEFFRGYLEARFLPGMTWGNAGSWHVDHRIPCVEFDLRDPVQQRQCFHYSNLQPLWAKDNLRKSSARPQTHQAELL